MADAKLAYERRGEGEPVVLLHGTGGSRRVWDPVLDEIAASRDVIAVDSPGSGDSPQLDGKVTPDRMAAAIAGLLRDLELDKPAVAGHSMGGWVALELAKLGVTGPVLAFAPAGLWRRHSPLSRTLTVGLSGGLKAHGALAFWRHFIPTCRTRFRGGQTIETPLKIVVGDRDRIARKKTSQNRDELPGHAVWETWPDCGHMVMRDAPDRVVAAVKAL